jgi:nucleoside-diphosphate-sugar epimerase
MTPPDLNSITTVADLEDALSFPTVPVLETLRKIDGDVMLLGAGGKMGPTLARMVRRGFDATGQNQRKVIAVSRFSSTGVASDLRRQGVEVIPCDLIDRNAVADLPDVANLIYMAGQKFGTSEAPEKTWAMNTVVPAIVAERFAKSRIVVFSTGCVYPLVPINSRGSREEDPLTPPGEYANSCVGRERVFTYFANQAGTPTLLFRLCYAIDLRYGVLIDVARNIAAGVPVDVSMGAVNVIWQGDANARAIQCLDHATSPPTALNITSEERVSIRELANRFGEMLGRPAIIQGSERDTCWLWDASRSYQLFGPPTVSLNSMIDATANWIRLGGELWNKPTHFEVQNGNF